MRKITILLALLLFAVSQGAFAQRTITGTVISSEDGLGMPGVTVMVKGTTIGTATDINGNYSLNVPNDATLVVSFMGFRSVEMAVGSQTRINATLEPDVLTLGDVVVTALGIQRETKTLTYSAQQVSGAEMMKAQDINFMNALSGRAAGVEINQTASGVGGSTRAVLRGTKSLTSVSTPLYVIDGVPMVNRSSGSVGLWGGTDLGDGLSSLNPDDIESMSILKGANAAVLYGSQGANGVILITTKKGQAGTTNISISSSATFDTPMLWPELQFKYGDWTDNVLSDPAITMQDIKDFFQTGYNLVNNISLSGGNRNTNVYFSYANNSSRGITPTNTYNRHNVSLRGSTKFFNDKLTISSNVMFSSEERYNPARAGNTMNPLFSLYQFPRAGDKNGKDIHYYKENYSIMNPTRQILMMNWDDVAKNHFENNPWWLLNKHQNTSTAKRVIAGVTADLEIAKGLKFVTKVNYDYAYRVRDNRMFSGGNEVGVGINGQWSYSEFADWLAYWDGVLMYNTNFGDFSINALAGGSTQESLYGKGMSVSAGGNEGLYFPNEFNFQNVWQTNTFNQTLSSRIIKQGLFANASIGYKEMLFLDLSGRNDWSSTLALSENGVSYFYPAVGFSAIISQMVQLPSFITFGKVRGSYTIVANDISFNNIFPVGTITSRTATGASVTTPSRPTFYEAKPEMVTSYELGTDWRFLEGRAGLDFTFYHVTSRDQFFEMPTLQGTGYNSRYMNVGEILNKGVEIVVDAEPVSTGNFKWHTSVNFYHNKNKIIVLNPEDPNYIMSAGGENRDGYASYVVQGGAFGDIYTFSFQYDEQGRLMVDKDYRPLRSAELERKGLSTPKFTMGWNNTLTYKRFSMDFLIKGVFGGIVVSKVEAMYDGWDRGVSKRSADARENGGVDVNAIVYHPRIVVINDLGNEEEIQAQASNHGQTVNKIDAERWFKAVGGQNPILENYMYDRTNIRLTQFSLNYDIPVRQLNLPLKSASVGFTGQNLFFIFKKAPYDPELTMNAGSGTQALDNFTQPPTRTLGFNLKVNF